MKTVFITGADRGIGFAICQEFLEHGWSVFAGQFLQSWKDLEKLQEKYKEALTLVPLNVAERESIYLAAEQVEKKTEKLDILVNCAGIGAGDSPAGILQMYKVNTLGPMCMTEAFLPLLKRGMGRLCFVSSEAGSISVAHRKDDLGYCMSKAALNMAVRLMFNRLSGEGYTFRLYHPGWVNSYMGGDVKSTEGTYEPEDTAKTAYKAFTQQREWEDVLAMTDIKEEIWPF